MQSFSFYFQLCHFKKFIFFLFNVLSLIVSVSQTLQLEIWCLWSLQDFLYFTPRSPGERSKINLKINTEKYLVDYLHVKKLTIFHVTLCFIYFLHYRNLYQISQKNVASLIITKNPAKCDLTLRYVFWDNHITWKTENRWRATTEGLFIGFAWLSTRIVTQSWLQTSSWDSQRLKPW